MKKAKTKAPARKAAKTPRLPAKAKASTKTATSRTVAKAAAKAPAKPVAAKGKAAKPATVAKAKAAPRAAEKPSVPAVPRKALTLPPKPASATTPPTLTPLAPVAAPLKPVAPKPASRLAARADVPPEAGFTLLVDGHFKNQFETLIQATQAATELKSRFPILRVEIYDAAKKTRLPV